MCLLCRLFVCFFCFFFFLWAVCMWVVVRADLVVLFIYGDVTAYVSWLPICVAQQCMWHNSSERTGYRLQPCSWIPRTTCSFQVWETTRNSKQNIKRDIDRNISLTFHFIFIFLAPSSYFLNLFFSLARKSWFVPHNSYRVALLFKTENSFCLVHKKRQDRLSWLFGAAGAWGVIIVNIRQARSPLASQLRSLDNPKKNL